MDMHIVMGMSMRKVLGMGMDMDMDTDMDTSTDMNKDTDTDTRHGHTCSGDALLMIHESWNNQKWADRYYGPLVRCPED